MAFVSLPLGYRLYTFDVVTSTMDEAHQLAQQGEPEKTLVVAGRQTKGRGRRGRPWISAPGNLHLSLIFRPKGTLDLCTPFSFILCLAIGHSLHKILPPSLPVFYKWPNDIVVSGAKIGGVLLEAETTTTTGAVKWLIGGVGVNVVDAPKECPFPTISLKDMGINIKSKDLLLPFCLELQSLLTLWRSEGFSAIRALWLKQAYGLDTPLVVQGVHQIIKGVFSDLDTDGSLILKTASGEKKKILTGDIMLFNQDEPREPVVGSR